MAGLHGFNASVRIAIVNGLNLDKLWQKFEEFILKQCGGGNEVSLVVS